MPELNAARTFPFTYPIVCSSSTAQPGIGGFPSGF